MLSTLLLDPFEEFIVLSRVETTVHGRDRSFEIDCSTLGILPFPSSIAFDWTQVGEAKASSARVAGTNERIDILFTSKRGPVDVGYEVAMRSEIGTSGLGKLVDNVVDDRHGHTQKM